MDSRGLSWLVGMKLPHFVHLFSGSETVSARKILRASLPLARTSQDDECLVAQLQQWIAEDIDAAWRVKVRLETRRRSYDYDRAYRLLVAALTSTPVQPPEACRQVRLKEEEELGRMPLRDAFDRLVHVVPELDEMRRSLEAKPFQNLGPHFDKVKTLMGNGSPHDGDVAGSTIAVGIAMNYLEVLTGDTRRGNADTPYFVIVERPRITMLW